MKSNNKSLSTHYITIPMMCLEVLFPLFEEFSLADDYKI